MPWAFSECTDWIEEASAQKSPLESCPPGHRKVYQDVSNNRQGTLNSPLLLPSPPAGPSIPFPYFSLLPYYLNPRTDTLNPQTRLAYSRTWHHIDVSSAPSLGRLASHIATVLTGKHKPTWDPSTDCGDYVVATNCRALHVTGKKMAQKQYYTHTTRPGSLKAMSMERLVEKWGAGEVLRRAVSGMLPKNRLRKGRLERLKSEWFHFLCCVFLLADGGSRGWVAGARRGL